MMKNKNKKRKVTLLVIILLLLGTAFAGFDQDALARVRNVDIIKIYTCGILTGVLILTIKDIIGERRKAS